MSNSSIWPLDRTLSGASTPDDRGPGSDGNEWVLRIPQSSSITGASPLDCLVSYPGRSLGGGVLRLCRDAVGVFCNPRRLNQELMARESQRNPTCQCHLMMTQREREWARERERERDWLIDFKGMSNRLWQFYSKRFWNYLYCNNLIQREYKSQHDWVGKENH